jgi:anti-sigma factor RsiW
MRVTRRGRRGMRWGRRGMRTVRGCMMRGWGGDGSTSGSASSRRVRTSHLVRPPVAPREENMVVIINSGDG